MARSAPKTPANKPAAARKTPAKSAAKTAAKIADKPAAGKRVALAEGAKAPAFTLPGDNGKSVALKDFAGRNLVLFFYPKANTPGCTREAIAFSALRAEFAKANTALVGVSADSPAAQKSFREKHDLTVELGSDETRKMLEAYGAWGEKSNYGKTYLGIIRSTVLVDAEGRIARVWPNVKVDGHAEKVLEAARALG